MIDSHLITRICQQAGASQRWRAVPSRRTAATTATAIAAVATSTPGVAASPAVGSASGHAVVSH
eukprot:6109148-Pleurochrysis_carterae.AAC.4